MDDQTIKVILCEIQHLRDDLRAHISEIRLDVKKINTLSKECDNKFIKNTTFWKIVGTLFVLISGSYAFTSSVFRLLQK